MKIKRLDSKGNIVGTTAILIVALLLIAIFVVTTINYIKNTNLESEANEEYKKKYDIDLTSEALSVEPTDDPWKLLLKVKLNGKKDDEMFSEIVESNSSIEGLRDPLPIAKLTIASGIMAYDDKIHYKSALSAYMLLHNFDSPESYLEATAPMTMKKCPYDPMSIMETREF